MKWDFFICHATEDKADIAKPLADILHAKGYSVWYDEYTMKLGDNLRRSIEQGLGNSRFGVVILSKSFFEKKWTQLELDGLFALERPDEKRILPVWHNVSATDVEQFSSLLAMRLGVSTSKGLEHVVEKIVEAVAPGEVVVPQIEERHAARLHPHSIEILQAAQVGDGSITTIWHMSGFSVMTGRTQLGEPGDPRAIALNMHCLDELHAGGFIERRSDSVSTLTQEGFDYQIPAGVIDAPSPQFPSISAANFPYAKQIMQGAVAHGGRVLSVGHLGGHIWRAGKWYHDSGMDRREEARLKSVINELERLGLLLRRSDTVYLVSHNGFLWTDSVSASEANRAKPGES